MLLRLNDALIIIPTLLYSFYILWQIVAWLKLPASALKNAGFKTSVSLIIPARNESGNIGGCLNAILQQDYPADLLEIIIVDDHSEDNTRASIENTLSGKPYRWKYLQLPDGTTNKKNAITAGVEKSDGELIAITDADCIVPETWIKSIVLEYEKHRYKMICGPVALTSDKSFLAGYQGLEMAGLTVLAGGGIYSGAPLLCNGANMAYTREAFVSVKGFQGIDNLPTGDDTQLLFKIHKAFRGQIGFLKSKDAVVYTSAQPTWDNFFHQRIRWASKGFRSGNPLNSLVSALVFVTNLLLLVYGLGALVYFRLSVIFLMCLIVKFTVDFLLLTCGCIFINRRKLLIYFLAGEFVTALYVVWVGIMANFSRYTWKGRTY
jgi:biofilm PGA synthesis N-glycosyltransferase PgaC